MRGGVAWKIYTPVVYLCNTQVYQGRLEGVADLYGAHGNEPVMFLQVRGELQEEKEEKVDLVTEKVKAEEELAALRDLSSQVKRPRISMI